MINSNFTISGFRPEDRKNIEVAIQDLLDQDQFGDRPYTLVYHNKGQTELPTPPQKYQPFEITMTDGTEFTEHMHDVDIYSRSVIIRLFVHLNANAQDLFQQKNPLLFNPDSSYSRQVMSITPN